MKAIVLLCLFISLSFSTENLTLKKAILHYRDLAPQDLDQLSWVADTNLYAYVQDSVLIRKGPDGGEQRIVDLNMLSQSVKHQLDDLPHIQWRDANRFIFWISDSLFTYSLKNKQVEFIYVLPDDAENKDLADKSYSIAYTRENNLYLQLEGGESVQITDEKTDIVSGHSVSRNEFGIRKGTFWSPDENYLAFYQKDESRVESYPFVDYDSLPAALVAGKYPMAGRPSEYVRIGIFDIQKRQTIWLDTDIAEEPEQYLTGITWSPDENYIYVAHITRDQNELKMIRYEARTGKRDHILFTEHDDQYIDPQFGPFFSRSNPSRFLWFSERDGWNHLYLYSSEGHLIRQVSDGNYDLVEFIGYGHKSDDWIYCIVAAPEPIERQVVRYNLTSGEMEYITSESGSHRVMKSEVSDQLLITFSSIKVANRITLCERDGTIIDTLLIADNPLKDYKLGRTEISHIRLPEGTKLYYSIVYPPGFDTRRKYPMLVYVYGGPHSQRVQNRWLARTSLWLQYLATSGYIVFTIDNRGTDYRGLEFEQITHGRLGTIEVQDQVAGIEHIIGKGFVDRTCIGVFGWSYGGFMTASLLTRVPDLFRVGVSGAPVIDWKYYEVMYTERYMDDPQSNAEGYDTASVITHLDSLQADLLMIHGTSDNIVMWQHSILFTKNAIQRGKQMDYMIYPGHRHGVRGRDRMHLYRKITDYFNVRLEPDADRDDAGTQKDRSQDQ